MSICFLQQRMDVKETCKALTSLIREKGKKGLQNYGEWSNMGNSSSKGKKQQVMMSVEDGHRRCALRRKPKDLLMATQTPS